MTPAAATGRLVAFEGIDGCGKTTQAHLLADSIGAVLTHEPGATPLGEELRRVLLGATGDEDGEGPLGAPSARAEALLMAADRAQHVTEVVRPALLAGRHVVTDRFSASTLAYQGWGRGLALAPLRALVEWAAGGMEPDLYVLVDVPVAVARKRLASGDPDRLERLDEGFFGRVREGYLSLCADHPLRWALVDGTHAIEVVAREVATIVAERLGPTAGCA